MFKKEFEIFKKLTEGQVVEKCYYKIDDNENEIGERKMYYIKESDDGMQIECEILHEDFLFTVVSYFDNNGAQLSTYVSYNQEECACMKKTAEFIDRLSDYDVIYEQDEPVVFSVTKIFSNLDEFEYHLNNVINLTKSIIPVMEECLNLDELDFNSQPKLCEYFKENISLFSFYKALIENHPHEDCHLSSNSHDEKFHIGFTYRDTDFIIYEDNGSYKISHFVELYDLENSQVKAVANAVADAALTNPSYDDCRELLIERSFTCESEDYLEFCKEYEDDNLNQDELLAEYVIFCNEVLLDEIYDYVEDEFDVLIA